MDLIADSLTPAATTIEAGQDLALTWAGHVEGTTAVGGPFSVGIYLSADDVVDDLPLVRAEIVQAENLAECIADVVHASGPWQGSDYRRWPRAIRENPPRALRGIHRFFKLAA